MNRLLPLLFTLLFVTACSDDEGDDYPSLTYEFVEAAAGTDGCLTHITNDHGTSYGLTQRVWANVKDSTLRCIAGYSVSADSSTATLYSIQHIYSEYPVPAETLEEPSQSPVKLQSWWRGGKYINIIIGILTTGHGTHKYAFSDNGITANDDGTKTANISLIHQRPANDAESYTETVYLSLPVEAYKDQCNSISLSINTYEGEQTKTFTLN